MTYVLPGGGFGITAGHAVLGIARTPCGAERPGYPGQTCVVDKDHGGNDHRSHMGHWSEVCIPERYEHRGPWESAWKGSEVIGK